MFGPCAKHTQRQFWSYFWCSCYNLLTMKAATKTPRVYKKITAAQLAEFKALKAMHGNGTAAVRAFDSTRLSPKDRAYRLTKKSEQQATADFIDDKLQQIGIDAVNRVGKLVNSNDERTATKNAHYVIDHIRGQATKKSITLSGKLKFQSVLD
jgi:hypothetical protein